MINTIIIIRHERKRERKKKNIRIMSENGNSRQPKRLLLGE